MVDGRRARNWGARVLAPLAFFAAVTILVLVVQSSLDDDETEAAPVTVIQPAVTAAGGETSAPPEPPPPEPPPPEPAPATSGASEETPRKETYLVRSGDTLESIAERFDTTVAALLELNPNIDPLALRPDQKIRVK